MTEYKSIAALLDVLGYINPCPNAGKWNKKAQKLRSEALLKLNLKQYQVGSAKEYEGGGYIKVAVYEYEGVLYSRA